MPELEFKGKEFVRNHHLTVPYRPLVPDASKGIGEPDLDGNLIIHGDNLEALKALLPKYAGKVDCIFIDPPYNTGNEGWSYNDKVNSPVMKAWFSENPVGIDDGLRHDKWCCMMWPRLKLLWELMADEGMMAVCIDDNEIHRLKLLLTELNTEGGAMYTFVWRRRISSSMSGDWVSTDHEYVACVSKTRTPWILGEERDDTKYSLTDEKGRRYASMPLTVGMTKEMRPNQWYELVDPISGDGYWPPPNRVWGLIPTSMQDKIDQGRILWPREMTERAKTPRYKSYPEDAKRERKQLSTLMEGVGRTEEGSRMLLEIIDGAAFPYPKPLSVISFFLEQLAAKEAIILDSFAGSGTTAHAVLNLNKKDGGNRKFILVEMEDYADTLTAERVRRVINGYPYKGTQKETLYEKKLTWTELKKGDTLRQEAENMKAMYEANYDAIKITVDDGVLKVIGERNVEETAPGLGGTFTYCTLGEPIGLEPLLKGKNMPERKALGDWLLYVAGTSSATEKAPKLPKSLQDHFLAKQDGVYYWFLYQPEKEWLKDPKNALTLDLAREIAKVDPKATHRVFGPQKLVSNKLLRQEKLNIEFANIPFALFRRGAE
jgi:adenine-specific DNA-methyltransferase